MGDIFPYGSSAIISKYMNLKKSYSSFFRQLSQKCSLYPYEYQSTKKPDSTQFQRYLTGTNRRTASILLG